MATPSVPGRAFITRLSIWTVPVGVVLLSDTVLAQPAGPVAPGSRLPAPSSPQLTSDAWWQGGGLHLGVQLLPEDAEATPGSRSHNLVLGTCVPTLLDRH